MALVVFDRVRESNVITGTGNVTLGGSLSGFRTFASAMTNGQTTWYSLVDNVANAWEVGIGTWNTGNTLTRTTVLASTNSGSLVTFAGNVCDCFITFPAELCSGATAFPALSTGTFTASSTVTLSPASANVVLSPTGTGVVTIAPATLGTMDNMTIGGTTPATAAFSGITFGANVDSSQTSLAKHIQLHTAGYGFGITANQLNYVVPMSARHIFLVNGAFVASVDLNGLNGTIGTTTASTGAFTALTTSGQVTHNGSTAVIVDANTAAPATLPTGTNIQTVGAVNTKGGILIDTVGTGNLTTFSYIYGRRTLGTVASPTALANNSAMFQIGALGYANGAYTTTPSAYIIMASGGSWTSTSNPSYIEFFITSSGTTTPSNPLTIWTTGDVLVGTGNGGDISGGGALQVVGGTQTDTLIVNTQYNTGNAFPALPTNTVAGIVGGTPGTAVNVTIDAFAANGTIYGRRAQGTLLSPTTVTSAQQLLGIGVLGYNSSAYTTTPAAGIVFQTFNTWITGDNSTQILFNVTASGSTTQTTVMQLQNSGILTIGTTSVSGSSILQVTGGITTDTLTATSTVFGNSFRYYGSGNASLELLSGGNGGFNLESSDGFLMQVTNAVPGTGTTAFLNIQAGTGTAFVEIAGTATNRSLSINSVGSGSGIGFQSGNAVFIDIHGNTTATSITNTPISGSTGSFTTLTASSTVTLSTATEVTVPVAVNPTDAVQKTYVDTATSTGLVLRGYIAGCNITVASTTTFTVSVGQVMSDDDTTMMTLVSALTKSTAGTWVVGNNQNGLDTGSIAANTWYHVFVINKPSTNTTDILFSLSATSPTLPSGYTKQRRVGSLRAGAGASLFTIIQTDGDRFEYTSPINIYSASSFGNTTANTVTLFCPTGVIVEVLTSGAIYDSTNATVSVWLSNLATTDVAAGAASAITAITAGAATTYGMWADLRTVTNTSGQIRIRCASATTSFYLNCNGYIDTRGRFA